MPVCPPAARKNDPVLIPYLEAVDDRETERHLRRLLEEVALPILEGVLRSKLGISLKQSTGGPSSQQREEAEDLRGEMLVLLVERLRKTREAEAASELSDFRAYAGVTAYSVVNRHWRRKYPRRFSLENKARYLLERTEGLVIWQDEHKNWVCGFAAWRSQKVTETQCSRLQQVSSDPAAFERDALPCGSAQQTSPTHLVAALFDKAGGPVLLENLVAVLAVLWDIRDQAPEPMPDQELPPPTKPGGLHQDAVRDAVLGNFTLKTYWAEMCRLPAKQIVSIVLDTQDNMVRLLIGEGAIPPSEVLRATELSPETLVSSLPKLPLKDAEIGALLGITSNYVAKMRVAARQYLAHQIRAAS